MPNIPWTDVNISAEEYANRFWVNSQEWLIHREETEKIQEKKLEDAKSVAMTDIVKDFIENEMPAGDSKVDDFTKWLEKNQ